MLSRSDSIIEANANQNQFIMLSELTYILSTTFLKLAIGLFFMRILVKAWQTTTFKIFLVVSTIYGLFYSLLAIFQCKNPAHLFSNILAKKCISDSLLLGASYTYAVMNILTDFTFVIIPIFMLQDSTMDKRSKLSVATIMALGAV
jgi:hypothetical protein